MTNDKISEIEQKYMNKMQLKVNCIDTNVIIAEIAEPDGQNGRCDGSPHRAGCRCNAWRDVVFGAQDVCLADD